jgi:hypothetical protein
LAAVSLRRARESGARFRPDIQPARYSDTGGGQYVVRELAPVDVSDVPGLAELIENVERTGSGRRIVRDGRDVAVLMPAARVVAARERRFRRLFAIADRNPGLDGDALLKELEREDADRRDLDAFLLAHGDRPDLQAALFARVTAIAERNPEGEVMPCWRSWSGRTQSASADGAPNAPGRARRQRHHLCDHQPAWRPSPLLARMAGWPLRADRVRTHHVGN